MKFDDVIESRHSVRSFKTKPVDFRDILAAIDTALQGPFAGNLNGMHFLIIEDEEKIDKLADISEQLWINGATAMIIACSNERTLESEYDERGRVYSRQQAGAAINSILLKLTDLGLGACWVGAYADSKIKKFLGIPEPIQIEALIPIGFEKGSSKKKSKKPLSGSISWEKWGTKKRPTIFKEIAPDMPKVTNSE